MAKAHELALLEQARTALWAGQTREALVLHFQGIADEFMTKVMEMNARVVDLELRRDDLLESIRDLRGVIASIPNLEIK